MTLQYAARRMRTQVGIVGAGPAGLTLAHLLQLRGDRVGRARGPRAATTSRRGSARACSSRRPPTCSTQAGVGERMQREGIVHRGIELQFDGERHRIAFERADRRARSSIYGQTEVVKDLIAARARQRTAAALRGRRRRRCHDLDGERPRIRYRHDGATQELECDVIAGCDGFHGVCAPERSPPASCASSDREYPFGWLGILAAGRAVERRARLRAPRARLRAAQPALARALPALPAVRPDEDIAEWPDERIWDELPGAPGRVDGWTLHEGPILEKGVTPMRSFVAEPMQYGRLFLAGDAAHIVPPTGAKGLNLAVQDVRVLAEALVAWYRDGDRDDARRVLRDVPAPRLARGALLVVDDLDAAPDPRLRRVHARLQQSQLRYLRTSRVAATSLAENYVGVERA